MRYCNIVVVFWRQWCGMLQPPSSDGVDQGAPHRSTTNVKEQDAGVPPEVQSSQDLEPSTMYLSPQSKPVVQDGYNFGIASAP